MLISSEKDGIDDEMLVYLATLESRINFILENGCKHRIEIFENFLETGFLRNL